MVDAQAKMEIRNKRICQKIDTEIQKICYAWKAKLNFFCYLIFIGNLRKLYQIERNCWIVSDGSIEHDSQNLEFV